MLSFDYQIRWSDGTIRQDVNVSVERIHTILNSANYAAEGIVELRITQTIDCAHDWYGAWYRDEQLVHECRKCHMVLPC